ncbi:hypothetical protein C8J56DRAFT_881877 [Mycena floridula]|nr:hypothetical protein C8J56DRAFT_881877 [Mycena floridula]
MACYSPRPVARYLSSYDYSCSSSGADNVHLLNACLRSRLSNAMLKNMPPGFPFRFTCDAYGVPNTSYDSYEFREDIQLSPRGEYRTVTFTFNNNQYLTWKACFQGQNHSRLTVATVQVERRLMDTAYGRFIRKDPKVILRAMAMSLELGVMVTITLQNLDTPLHRVSKFNKSDAKSCLGVPVLYIGTRYDGTSAVLHNDYFQH